MVFLDTLTFWGLVGSFSSSHDSFTEVRVLIYHECFPLQCPVFTNDLMIEPARENGITPISAMKSGKPSEDVEISMIDHAQH